MWHKLYLRFRQLGRSLTARPLSVFEQSYIQTILTPAQYGLFAAFPLYEQRHALNVCRTLVGVGYGTDRELLQAALLHDLGKFDAERGRSIPVWVKVANVVLQQLPGPDWSARLGQAAPVESWRYWFWLQASHEKRGARLALAAGSSHRVVALVGGCRNLKRRGDPVAHALAWADDLN